MSLRTLLFPSPHQYYALKLLWLPPTLTHLSVGKIILNSKIVFCWFYVTPCLNITFLSAKNRRTRSSTTDKITYLFHTKLKLAIIKQWRVFIIFVQNYKIHQEYNQTIWNPFHTICTIYLEWGNQVHCNTAGLSGLWFYPKNYTGCPEIKFSLGILY